MSDNTFSERLSEIQDFANKPRKQYALQQDRPLIPMIFSCLGTIANTEKALESYLKTDFDSLDIGVKYLFIYGVLQALIVQQEAVENLYGAFNISYIEDPKIENIRHIRIDAAGHPTNRGNRKAFNFIDGKTLNANGFELMTVRPETGNKSEYTDVNIPNLITTQKSVFMEVLTNLIKKLKEEDVEHKKKFEGKKLANIFDPTEHLFSKINEAIVNPNSPYTELAETHVYEIGKCVNEFITGLEDRGEPDVHIYHIYEELEKFLKSLMAYFQNGNDIRIPKKYAYAFARIEQGRVEELKTIVENYDISSDIRIPMKYVGVFALIAQGHVKELKAIAENYDQMYSQAT